MLHAYHIQLYMPAFTPLEGIKAALCSCSLPFSRYVHYSLLKKSFLLSETRVVNPTKTSTGFELAQTASRIALTFIPLVWLKNFKFLKVIKSGSIRGVPTTEEDKARYLKGLRHGRVLLRVLLSIPFVLFWATIIASLERTPLTGRCVRFFPELIPIMDTPRCLLLKIRYLFQIAHDSSFFRGRG